MIKSAIIHRPDREQCYSVGAHRFVVQLRAAHGDLSSCVLNCRDKYISQHSPVPVDKNVEMTLAASDSVCDYYETEVDFDGICLRYYFKLTDTAGNVAYFGNGSFFDEPMDDVYYMFDLPRISREEDGCEIPAWAAGAVVYQIFPDRFAPDEEPSPDDGEWYQAPMGHSKKLCGTLRGITRHLPHLSELGVDAIYLNPIFKSPSSHKYNTEDYLKIDADFGTEGDLKELVSTAHSMNIRVILDGVFNHCDPNFFAFKDVMENQEKSPYRDWFYIHSFPVKWEMPKKFTGELKPPNYETFSYFGGMPKLNCNCPAVRDYVAKVIDYWMSAADIDGWRLDVADEIGHDFWRFFRREVKRRNPDALIVGEIWAHNPAFVQGDEWDSYMNYRFYNAVRDCVAGGIYPVSHLASELSGIRGNSNSMMYTLLWNLIGSHDTPRFLRLAGDDTRRLKLASVIQLTLTGMPVIYYGDEYGMTGGMDPDCRRGMLWDSSRQNHDVYEHYRRLIALRKQSAALRIGELKFTVIDDEQGLLIYEKAHSDERVAVAVNLSESRVTAEASQGTKLIGKPDLMSGSAFDGQIPPLGFAIIGL